MPDMSLEFEWWNDTGADAWFLMAENDYLAENYWAKVTGSGPYVWEVGMGFPEGIALDNGEAPTREQAQHDAEKAWKRVVDQ